MSRDYASVSGQDRADARLIWGYHHMGHEPRPCSAAIGMGSHDLGVATFAAGLAPQGVMGKLIR